MAAPKRLTRHHARANRHSTGTLPPETRPTSTQREGSDSRRRTLVGSRREPQELSERRATRCPR